MKKRFSTATGKRGTRRRGAAPTAKPADQRTPVSATEARRRTHRVLTRQRASITHSIAEAVVIKDGDLFFLSEADGKVPLEGAHGCGLYYHDCRYLDGYEIRLANADLDVLAANAAAGNAAVHELTNPDIRLEGGQLLQKEELGVKLHRTIDGEQRVLHDAVAIQNFMQQPVVLPLAVTFRTAFDDIFEVRGARAERVGRADAPVWRNGVLRFVYHGVDGIRRELRIHCSPGPKKTDAATGLFLVHVEPQAVWSLRIGIQVIEADARTARGATTDGTRGPAPRSSHTVVGDGSGSGPAEPHHNGDRKSVV